MLNKISGFDGIRALAVIAVVLTHLHVFEAAREAGWLNAQALKMIDGAAGVQAFFVLSGFLITTLLIREYEETGTISIFAFVIRRTLRIFPLYIAFLLAITVLHVFGRSVTTWDSLLYAYLYAYNFIPIDTYTPVLGHTWSLAVEEHFYLLWPAVFLLLFARSRGILSLTLVAFIIGAPFLHLLIIKSGFAADYFVERWSFIAGSAIAVGCLFSILLHNNRAADKLQNFASKPLTLVTAIILFSNSIYLASDSWFFQNILSNQLRILGLALFVAWTYTNQSSRLTQLLETRPLKYIGAISYGIYMYQGFFLATGPHRAPHATWPPPPELGLLCLLVIAPASYHFFEKPFLRLKHRYSSPGRAALERTSAGVPKLPARAGE